MSPHEALLSASGLRPLSAFVVVGSVVLAVAVWVVRLAAAEAPQPARVRCEESAPPAFAITARDGRTLACSVPRFDLELSPRSLWQAHTPRRIAAGLADALEGRPSADELLRALLPDVDALGEVHVEGWDLTARAAQRVHDWIASGAGTERGPLSGFRLERARLDAYRLVWRPEVALSEEERRAHGVSQAWRWARRLADGLHEASGGVPLDAALVPESEARRARERVWKALLPTAFARPLCGIDPERVLALREELARQGVAAWQMRVAYGRDRAYPAGTHELIGDWGYLDAESTVPTPRSGLERLCGELLADPHDGFLDGFLERCGEVYRWIDDRPVRGARASGYLAFVPGSEPPAVRTTIDAGLQAFLGSELRAALETHRAAVAMGIVLDVQGGEILAIDSAEAYPIQPFAPVYHVFTTGSTFKVVSMAVALEEGVVTPDTVFDVGAGEYRITLPDGRSTGRVIREAEGALTGRHTAGEFFAFSVNAALAQIGLCVDDRAFHGYLARLRYGQPSGSGLGPERAGNLPSLPWSYAYTHASLGFGHEISTTLWRHAEGLATVIRGGERVPLRVLEAVEQGGRRLPVPRPAVERVFSARTAETVRELMRLGAREGTGREVRETFSRAVEAALGSDAVAGLDLGTKTGTAQKVPTELCVHLELGARARWEEAGLPATRERIAALERLEKPHGRCYTSSICAFGRVPGSERELMVLIIVDEPRGKERFGSRVAGPTATRVLAEALGLTVNGHAPSHAVAEGFGTPDPALLAAFPPARGGGR